MDEKKPKVIGVGGAGGILAKQEFGISFSSDHNPINSLQSFLEVQSWTSIVFVAEIRR